MTHKYKKVAFWFKYGPAEHTELFHAIPGIVKSLSETCEVHYFGMKSKNPVPREIIDNAVVHHLPFTVDRTSGFDKGLKWILWYLSLPFIALKCRFLKIDLVYIDDYLPLGTTIAEIFYGGRIVMIVADFLHETYAEKFFILKPLAALINMIDIASWKRLPCVITHAEATRTFLVSKGARPERIHPIYDPCDMNLYHPIKEKSALREKLGYADSDIVLTHHGILHPNKGMHLILEWIAPVLKERKDLKFLIIGAGPELNKLKDQAERLEISGSVQFTGWLDKPSDVNEALNAADIGLVMRIGKKTDDFHATGALVHSMAAGLPVLGARLGGVSEIIRDGENGFLFNTGTGDEFREKLIKLVDSPTLRETFRNKTLALSKELFDMDKVIEKTINLLIYVSGCSGEADNKHD